MKKEIPTDFFQKRKSIPAAIKKATVQNDLCDFGIRKPPRLKGCFVERKTSRFSVFLRKLPFSVENNVSQRLSPKHQDLSVIRMTLFTSYPETGRNLELDKNRARTRMKLHSDQIFNKLAWVLAI